MQADLQSQVIGALEKLKPLGFACEVCSSQNWAVQKGLYWFSETYRSDTSAGYGPALPCASVVCQVCGNAKFLNIRVLIPKFQEYL